MKKIFLILFAVTALSIHSIYPQLKNELRKNFDEYMTRLTEFGYSGALLVAKEGAVIFSKGYGLANRTEQTPVAPEKSFTNRLNHQAVYRRCNFITGMHGKLNVQAPITKYFTSFPSSRLGRKATLRSATPSRLSLNNIIMKSGGGARSPSRLPRPVG